jgi:putative component of membrane protein insertase Oxa1/YidC/SpoIIIJ protein YidD
MSNWLLKKLAILAIRLYQILGRRFYQRTCLFRPTCSRRAIRYFQQYGFRKGLRLTRFQLSECKATYSLRFNSQGKVEMITHSGRVVPEEEINPVIARRLKQFQFMQNNNLSI